ncbi:MAG: hypothetical protein ACP5KB_04430 [Thermoprotei archaeon]
MNKASIVCDEKKHAGGKIVKVCIKICDDLVKGVMISGDFFVEPAENFEELLRELASIEVKRGEVITLITESLKKKNIEFGGITIEDVTEVLSKILQQK